MVGSALLAAAGNWSGEQIHSHAVSNGKDTGVPAHHPAHTALRTYMDFTAQPAEALIGGARTAMLRKPRV